MADVDRIDRANRVIDLLFQALKALGALFLVGFAIASFAIPKAVGNWLTELNIDQIDAVGVKLKIAKVAVKAGNDSIKVSEILTEAEVALGEGSTSKGMKLIEDVRSALGIQAAGISKAAVTAGATTVAPKEGWLYVGYFNSDDELVRAYSRIGDASGIRRIANASGAITVSQIVLKYDAPVTSDGNNCDRPDVRKFKESDINSPEIEYAIIRATATPLDVLESVKCPAVGKGHQVYAKVAVPADRVRFSKLSLLDVK